MNERCVSSGFELRNPFAKLEAAPTALVIPTMAPTANAVPEPAVAASRKQKRKTSTPTIEKAAVTMASHFCCMFGMRNWSTRVLTHPPTSDPTDPKVSHNKWSN